MPLLPRLSVSPFTPLITTHCSSSSTTTVTQSRPSTYPRLYATLSSTPQQPQAMPHRVLAHRIAVDAFEGGLLYPHNNFHVLSESLCPQTKTRMPRAWSPLIGLSIANVMQLPHNNSRRRSKQSTGPRNVSSPTRPASRSLPSLRRRR